MSEIIQDQIRDFKKRLKASIESFTDELTSLYDEAEGNATQAQIDEIEGYVNLLDTFDFEADFTDKVTE